MKYPNNIDEIYWVDEKLGLGMRIDLPRNRKTFYDDEFEEDEDLAGEILRMFRERSRKSK